MSEHVHCEHCGHEQTKFVIIRTVDTGAIIETVYNRLTSLGYAAREEEVFMVVNMVIDEYEGGEYIEHGVILLDDEETDGDTPQEDEQDE